MTYKHYGPPPYAYQRAGVAHIVANNGCTILADEQGLGKTPQAWWYAYRNVRGRTLIVCYASLKENWRREALRYANVRAHIIEGRKPYRLPNAPAYIINYDILGDPERDGANNWTRVFFDPDRDNPMGLKLVIVDECQAIRNWESKRSRAVRFIAKPVPHRLLLSGTPIENRPSEFYPAIHIVRPHLFPSMKLFLDRYCGPEEKPWGREYRGATETEELHKTLVDNGVLLRRRKADVLADLPAKTIQIVPMELPKKARAEYDHAFRDFIDWLVTVYGPGHRVEAALRAQRMARMGYLKKLAATLKLPMVFDWTDAFRESGKKLLMFGWHREVLLPIYERYQPGSLLVHGGILPIKRQPIFDAFNDDPTRDMLVANMQAAGAGWNCTAADYAAFPEMPWMPTLIAQAIDRMHGVGRGTGLPVTAAFLVAANTIEEDLCKVLQIKQDTIDMVLDGKKFKELNVYDLLTREYLNRETKGIPK